jgi:hypothetical protein
VLFPRQDAASLAEAVRFLEAHADRFHDPAPRVAQAERFSRDRFRAAVHSILVEEGALPGA